jgi:hypothetical protein
MKIIISLIFASLILGAWGYTGVQAKTTVEKDVITTLVWPCVSESVSGYYSEYLSGNVRVAPYHGTRIVSIDINNPTDESHPYKYLITVEVEPYIGAHNSVGKDRVIIGADTRGAEVCGFQHMESYEITHPYLKERIIKPLP